MFKIQELMTDDNKPKGRYNLTCYIFDPKTQSNREAWTAYNLDAKSVSSMLSGRHDMDLQTYAYIALKKPTPMVLATSVPSNKTFH